MAAAPKKAPAASTGPAARWTFLTNHGHVLLCLARDPEARLRDVAADVGITERMVQRIVAELADAGYLARRRVGRRNAYRLNEELPLRHPLEAHHSIRELLRLVGPADQHENDRTPRPRTRAAKPSA